MAEKRDYYEVLGVSKTADDKELKKPSGHLQESIILTKMILQMLMKNSKKYKRRTLFSQIQTKEVIMTDLAIIHRWFSICPGGFKDST